MRSLTGRISREMKKPTTLTMSGMITMNSFKHNKKAAKTGFVRKIKQ